MQQALMFATAAGTDLTTDPTSVLTKEYALRSQALDPFFDQFNALFVDNVASDGRHAALAQRDHPLPQR